MTTNESSDEVEGRASGLAGIGNFPALSIRDMAKYEAAIDVLNQRIGVCMSRVYAEEAKALPNAEVIASWRAQAQSLSRRMGELDSQDQVQVAAVLDEGVVERHRANG